MKHRILDEYDKLPGILTPKELKAWLRLGELSYWRKKGLPFIRIGRRTRYDKAQVLTYFKQQTMKFQRKVLEKKKQKLIEKEKEELNSLAKKFGERYENTPEFEPVEQFEDVNEE